MAAAEPLAPTAIARAYAESLLAQLGTAPRYPLDLPDEHAALTASRSGLMALTGRADGPPCLLPTALAACADGALAALASLAGGSPLAGLRGSALLAERAAFTGYTRNGATAPGGSCRLLETSDGPIALNLAREDDRDLLPAWLEAEVDGDDALLEQLRVRRAAELVARGRELGLAIARSPEPELLPWLQVSPAFSLSPTPLPRGGRGNTRSPRVVDLSALWAGPLCGHLLHRLGADVVKVESTQRPDGARRGDADFYDLLNAGKRSVALDFGSAKGRAQLRALIAAADIVIEASRPRALRQLGIVAEDLLRERPHLTWVSLSGYGRAPEWEQAIAYGDDAGVAGGLSALLQAAHGEPLFAGDAIADPLTGLHAALVAWAGWQQGGGRLWALSLAGAVRAVCDFDPVPDPRARLAEWSAVLAAHGASPAPPHRREPAGRAALPGADTVAVFADWVIAC